MSSSIRIPILLIGLLWSAFLFAIPPAANAGVILQAPTYVGLNSGLVGHWSFDGQDVAGVTAYDRSGNGNNGTLTSGPARVAGKIGQALEFDGSASYVSIADFGVEGASAMSLSVWAKSDDTSNQNGVVSQRTGGNVFDVFEMVRGAGINGMNFRVNTGSGLAELILRLFLRMVNGIIMLAYMMEAVFASLWMVFSALVQLHSLEPL